MNSRSEFQYEMPFGNFSAFQAENTQISLFGSSGLQSGSVSDTPTRPQEAAVNDQNMSKTHVF